MPTPAERRALLFVAAVAALGVGVRGCRVLAPPAVPEDARASLAAQLAAVDSAIAAGGRRPTRGAGKAAPAGARGGGSAAAPTGAAAPAAALRGPVDLDLAGLEELDALPGIGPALARRIVADRDSAGPFGSLEALQRVKGIGPGLAARLAPYVTFSGRARPTGAVSGPRRGQHP